MLANAGLNFVAMRICTGGGALNGTRYIETQNRESSNRITIAELQHVATARTVDDSGFSL